MSDLETCTYKCEAFPDCGCGPDTDSTAQAAPVYQDLRAMANAVWAQAEHEKAPEAFATGAAGSTERPSVLPDVPILAQAVPLLSEAEVGEIVNANWGVGVSQMARAIEQAVRAQAITKALAPQQAEAVPADIQRLQAVVTAFGPGAPVQFAQDTWAGIHAAIVALLAAPQQAEAVPPDVLRDTERYRALRSIENRLPAAVFQFHPGTALPNKHMILVGGHLDAFCDAYMMLKGNPSPAAQGAKT